MDVKIESGTGDVRERVPDEHGNLSRFLSIAPVENTVCLRFIDPYGDTVFNSQQMVVLEAEMKQALTICSRLIS